MTKNEGPMKRIRIGGSSESSEISTRKTYRVKVDGAWHEGRFTKQWFGWLFEGEGSQVQLNLIDEVYELPSPPPRRGRPKSS